MVAAVIPGPEEREDAEDVRGRVGVGGNGRGRGSGAGRDGSGGGGGDDVVLVDSIEALPAADRGEDDVAEEEKEEEEEVDGEDSGGSTKGLGVLETSIDGV